MTSARILKVVGFGILLLMLAIPLHAQNTKGDKPTTRDTRFQKTKKQKPAKRIKARRTTSSLRAYTPRKKSKGGEVAGRPTSPIRTSRSSKRTNVYKNTRIWVNNHSQTPKSLEERGGRSRATRRVTPRSATGTVRNVYPQSGQYVNRSTSTRDRNPIVNRKVKPRSASRSFIARRSSRSWARFPSKKPKQEKAYRGDISGRPLRTRNFESKRPAVIPPATTRRSDRGRRRINTGSGGLSAGRLSASGQERTVSNKATLARLNKLQRNRQKPPRRNNIVKPRSVSGSMISRRSNRAWAHFPRSKRKGEHAITTDIAGKKLRTKNYQTPPRGVIPQPTLKSSRTGERPYKGRASGRQRSISASGKVMRGDIAGRGLRRKNFTSKRSIEVVGQQRGGYRSVTGRRGNNGKVPVKTPGIGGKGLGNYQGNIRRTRGFSNQGEEYTGTIKAGRRVKGGGSLSGRLWNNNGSAISPRTPGIGANGLRNYSGNIRGRRGFSNQGEEYSGSIKAGRRVKGGGSLSGKLWNNKGVAISPRTPGIGANGLKNYSGNIRSRKGFSNQGEEYSGSIKARRPVRGGGSVSGKLWNNNQSAISGRTPGIGATSIKGYRGTKSLRRGFSNQGEEYTGSIKAKRPPKGGGSISGKLWNNQESPTSRPPKVRAMGVGKFRGNIRTQDASPGFNNQGEEYTGNIRARKPVKGGGSVSGKLWNNDETPIEVRKPLSEQGGEFRGKMKMKRGYVVNPNSAEGSLKKLKPTENVYRAGGLQIKVKQRESGFRKNAPEGALAGLKPTKESIRASEYAKGIRMNWRYIRNPNSSSDALKVREPGKAFARATDYQGNIKMKKFDLLGRKGLHPDAQFVKINKNNVVGEKDMFTNLKLWWARLFKKNDTQPDHLKDKDHKPRYDSGEKGLWYD